MGKGGLLLALITTAGLASACGPGPGAVPCPAIAQATAVSVTVAADYAPHVETLHVKACQDGQCKEEVRGAAPGQRVDRPGLHPGGRLLRHGFP
jgi:hypothetical protein